MPTKEIVAHTLGPWDIDGEGFVVAGEGDAPNADFVSLRYITAPCVSRHHVPTAEERAANARVLAAAPELLEALKVARKTLEIACGTTAPYIRQAFNLIDPALAKAEPPAPRESAQPCGCDPGANWICEAHRTAGAL